jgi:FixJ family two-component response regulator
MAERKLVSVVDDDESVRESLPDLLRSYGFEVQAFASAEAFLAWPDRASADCLLLDVAMPGMTGPQLLRELQRRGEAVPTVFITAHSDDKALPEAIRRGAVACLVKPFTETAIVEAVSAALASG